MLLIYYVVTFYINFNLHFNYVIRIFGQKLHVLSLAATDLLERS